MIGLFITSTIFLFLSFYFIELVLYWYSIFALGLYNVGGIGIFIIIWALVLYVYMFFAAIVVAAICVIFGIADIFFFKSTFKPIKIMGLIESGLFFLLAIIITLVFFLPSILNQ